MTPMLDLNHHWLRKSCFLFILFLCVACNQNLKQNVDSKKENAPTDLTKTGSNSPKKAPENVDTTTDIAIRLQGSKVPTLIYGSQPAYMTIEQEDGEWSCKFIDGPLDDLGMVDQSFVLNAKSGMEIPRQDTTEKYGLYFGTIPTKTKISICGTSQCRQITQQEFLAIKMNQSQFDELFSKSKEIDITETKEWSLYFLNDFQSFQSSDAAVLATDGKNPVSMDWNGVLDKTGKAPLTTDESAGLQIKSIQFKNEILIGKFKTDDQEYKIIGIERFHIMSPEE